MICKVMNLYTPTKAPRSAIKIAAGAASRLRTLSPLESKAHLLLTEHPNALPASWRCPGQHKGAVLGVCFTSARLVRFRLWMRLFQQCRLTDTRNRVAPQADG